MNPQILYEAGYYNRPPFEEDYRAGTLHLVGFAALGKHFFRCDLWQAGFNDEDATNICNGINRLNQTRTLWPKARLTGIPEKCVRSSKCTTGEIRSRLAEAFLINRDQVRCPKMVFNFKCGGDINRQRIESTIKELCTDEVLVGGLGQIQVYLDNTDGNLGYSGKFLDTRCPLCDCRISLSLLSSHMEKSCQKKPPTPDFL